MMPEPDTLRIQTAENVGIGFRVAGLGSRLMAQLVDLLIIVPTMLVLMTIGLGAVALLATSSMGQQYGALGVITLLSVFYYVYYAFLETVWSGQTPGKRALGLRVVRADGGAIGAADSLLRNLVRFLDVGLFGIGAVVIFATRRSQRLGDLAARTVVVRSAPDVPLPGALLAAAPVPLRDASPGPPLAGIDRIGQHEYSVLRGFLSRPDLHEQQRRRIAAQMAGTLIERMQLVPTAEERFVMPEVFLERLFVQLSQRYGGR